MIVELQAERQRLTEAIEALERLSTPNLPRRGRPPRWLNQEIERHLNDGEIPEPETSLSGPAKKKPS